MGLLFITLSKGPQGDMWLGHAQGTQRSLKWFGQETGRDAPVVLGTEVWVRYINKPYADYVGSIVYSVEVRKYDRMRLHRSASYNSLVELLPNPIRVHKAEGDLCVEETVLNQANISSGGGLFTKKYFS